VRRAVRVVALRAELPFTAGSLPWNFNHQSTDVFS
jgi:hypothetical protein